MGVYFPFADQRRCEAGCIMRVILHPGTQQLRLTVAALIMHMLRRLAL